MKSDGFIGLLIVVAFAILFAAVSSEFSDTDRRKKFQAACVKAGGVPSFPYRSTPLCLRPANVIPITP